MIDFPNRKQIRLKYYDYSENGFYFITICTHNRQKLFNTNVGEAPCGLPADMIKKWLYKLQTKFYGVHVHEYIIMSDHIHFILSKSGDHTGSPLHEIIDWFKTMTTNEYIKNVKNNIYPKFDKKIWQRSYYEHIIRNENDYIKAAEYIINNPVAEIYSNEHR